ncbi:DinB family protein [Caldibacillus lycopersici]|uniref:DinB family protein n=1 Tax=Perspicuibacillus lycopersici TaxID=1325689 RepID=A0AAE3LTZ5_9BACI|nr:DinB family protein [Perspicuibacillus lycopersici]MCU9614803.1 DinB family protein [Perspicuibacillus lycopersici]
MKTIELMFDHLYWANQSMLSALIALDNIPLEALRIYSHLLLAEKVWYNRLQKNDRTNTPIWSDLSIAQCAKLMEENTNNYRYYITNLTQTDLHQLITYRNSKQEEFTTSIHDILTHVALHGQYHRGQINKLLRIYNEEPINVDFITFVR